MAGEELDNAAELLREGLTAAAAWLTLRSHLALLAAAGVNPIPALRTAVEVRELDSAADPAAVLDWRLPAAGPPGPLPWLPGVPAALADDPHWGDYLTARAGHVTACAARVADTAAALTPATAPPWARPLLEPEQASLRADLAVWRAAHAVPDTDRRPTGPPRPEAAERDHQTALDQAVAAAGPARNSSVWAALADSIDPRLRRDPHWRALADRLVAADRAGLDAAGLLAAVTAARPLPDDLPAAALWWRLAPHLVPATVAAGPSAAGLRPDWCTTLLDLLPDGQGQRALVDPAWPALVAAVTTGTRCGWSAADLITAAVTGLPTTAGGEPSGHGLAEVLVFCIAALTDPAPIQEAEPLPQDLQPPDDADQAPPAEHPTAACTAVPDDSLLDDQDAPFDPDYDLPTPVTAPRYVTPDPFTRATSDVDDDADYLLEQHFWATSAVGRDRLIQLNDLAAAFFTGRYPGSWAPGYLRARLGTDPAADPRFNPGYAPAGWTALVDHLRGHEATDDEILAAGLGARARTGGVIDRFRDRLTFPIRDLDGAVRGFVARRNPAQDASDRAGPKYLNTPGTDLFTKGEQLFGLFENRRALAGGAIPAVVEGPLDALALTLAGDGLVVGVATLGTALTDRQADLLRPHIRADGLGVLVATDADPAGQQAAERIYWKLTACGDDPRLLRLPAGLDPADLLHRDGAGALRVAIESSASLADRLLGMRIEQARRAGLGTEMTGVVRDAAAIIAALPPLRWLARIDRVTAALSLAPGTVHWAVLDAAAGRDLPTRMNGTHTRDRTTGTPAPVAPPLQPPTSLSPGPAAAAPPPGGAAPAR